MSKRVWPDREELAWAAGFFDGEGCFSFTQAHRTQGWACVVIAQTTIEPLERFQRAVAGVGRIYGPYQPKYRDRWSRKPQFVFRAHRREHVQAIAAMLWFKLGSTKRLQALSVLQRLSSVCRRGHRLTGGRSCPRCVAEAWASKRRQRASGLGQIRLEL